jgi:hypothetical protein
MKIIHYTYFKPFHITKPTELPDPASIELWTIWHQMRDDMRNQSFIS